MTTIYKFKAVYTEGGLGHVPNPAPVATVINTDADTKLADAQATTALVNLPGYYEYEYSGADDLDLVCLFHTDDTVTDQQDLVSYVVEKVYQADAKLDVIDGIVDAILVDTGTTLPAVLDAIKGAGWTTENLVAIKSVIDEILTDTGTTLPSEIDAVYSDIMNANVEGTYTVQEIMRIMAGALAGKLNRTNNGDGTYTLTFRDLEDSLNRIIATVDSGLNRTEVVLDES